MKFKFKKLFLFVFRQPKYTKGCVRSFFCCYGVLRNCKCVDGRLFDECGSKGRHFKFR